MKVELEKYLWESIPTLEDYCDRESPRDVIHRMIQLGMINNAKQAWRTLDKWSSKGLYDWGVCQDLGWKCLSYMKPKQLENLNKLMIHFYGKEAVQYTIKNGRELISVESSLNNRVGNK